MRIEVLGDRFLVAPADATEEIRARPHLGALALARPALVSAADRALLGAFVASGSGADLVALDRIARTASITARFGLATWPMRVADVEAAVATAAAGAPSPARKPGGAAAVVEDARHADDAVDAVDDGTTALLAVLSMARDGRAREAAVAALDAREGWIATAALFVRVDDVVEPVAARAAQGLAARLVPARAPELIRCAPILEQREAGMRRTALGESARAEARALLLADDDVSRAALRAGLADDSAAVRDACRRLVVDKGDGSDAMIDAINAALDDGTMASRRFVMRRIGAGAIAPGVLAALLPRLARDASVLVRRMAVLAARRIGRRDVLEALCLDAQMSIRTMARTALGKAGGEEQRERARAILAGAGAGAADDDARARARGALAALAEIGRPEDFPWIAPYLHDTSTRQVAEAVRALVGMHASGGLEGFADVLHDLVARGAGRVAHEAALGLALLPRALVDRGVVAKRRALRNRPRLNAVLDRLLHDERG